jgi:phenylacetic acid degradation operon negative regulatory protein
MTPKVNTEHCLAACLQQVRPRLNILLKLMLREASALGHPQQWIGSAITLIQPLGYTERAIRTALFRLGEHRELSVERHGRRSLCMLTPEVAAMLQAEQQRLHMPPARSFGEDWVMLVNSGGLGAIRYAEARERLRALDYCQLSPNLLARPASYLGNGSAVMPATQEHGLAMFDVSGAQLAAAVRQPLFGRHKSDLQAASSQYRKFQQRFEPLHRLLDQRGAIDDEQAYRIRLLISYDYHQCRRGDPMLPQELLPEQWPAMAAYKTYLALYGGCAVPAGRHLLKIMAIRPPERIAAATIKMRPFLRIAA